MVEYSGQIRSEIETIILNLTTLSTGEYDQSLSFDDIDLGSEGLKYLISFEEHTYGIKFTDDAVKKLKTIEDFCVYVEELGWAKDA